MRDHHFVSLLSSCVLGQILDANAVRSGVMVTQVKMCIANSLFVALIARNLESSFTIESFVALISDSNFNDIA